METRNIQLTLIDRQILNSYKDVIDGLADYLGSGYEIVLHSLENLESSVIYIVNGEHTGRKIGAPITDRALEMLDKLEHDNISSSSYFSVNKNGEPLKSTTIAIRGENRRIIGLLCMNFYMDTGFYEFINGFVPHESLMGENSLIQIQETFANDADEMIESLLSKVRNEVYANDEISPANKNKAIIFALNEKGVFQFKNAVNKVADLLGISKNTIYLHLRNCDEKKKDE